MAELSKSKINGLARLVKRSRIEIEDIKDDNYREEVENKLNEE